MNQKRAVEESVIKGEAIHNPNDLLWKQYEVFVDLFKFYLDVAVKANIWFYTLTGAILTYFFKNKDCFPNLKYALIFPIIIGIGFGFIFLYGSYEANDMKNKITYIQNQLRLPGAPHTDILIKFLKFAGTLLLIIATTLTLFLYKF